MKIPVSKAYAKWMDEDAERLNAMAELARKVAVKLPSRKKSEKRSFLEETGGSGGQEPHGPDVVGESLDALAPSEDHSLCNRLPFVPSDQTNSEFVRVPDDEELAAAMGGNAVARKCDAAKLDIGGVPGKSISEGDSWIGLHRDLPDGTPVAFRIDIPTFNRTKKSGNPIYAVAVHEDNGKSDNSVGTRIGYDGIARMSGEVVFASKEKNATLVASGVAHKSPIATVKGKFDPSRTVPDDIDSWTAVGFDPQKAAYFYDKKSGREVTGGTDAVSVGNSVFVRLPKYGHRNAKETYRDAGFWGIEHRSADCGRDEGGRFGSGNDCASNGGAASSSEPPAPKSTPSRSKMPRGSVGDPANGTSWLSPDGTFYPVPRATPPAFRPKHPSGFMTHDAWASLNGHEGGEDGLLKAGWARVARSGNEILAQTVGRPLTPRQKKSLEDQSMMTGVDEVIHDSAPSMADRGGQESKYKTIWSKHDRSWTAVSEKRADCGRDESGRFDAENKCQENAGEGESGTATASPPSSDSKLFGTNANVSWTAASGDEPFPGASRFREVSVSGGKAVSKSLDSIGMSPGEAISLTGAPDRATVFARPAPEFASDPLFAGAASPPVMVGFEADVAGVARGLEATFAIGSRANPETGEQDRIVYGNVIDVLPEVSATPERRHAAARAFYRTMVDAVENARKSGVAVVGFSAAGNSTDADRKGAFRGYTIWPRMGFDGPLPPTVLKRLPPELSHARTLMDLHATREGTRWWAANGQDIDVELDLRDPNSPQSKIFDRFVRHFKTNRREMPLGEGEGWLSPEDAARLDEMWAEVWDDDGTLDDYEGAEQKFLVERRSADCGRDESGRFGAKNKCQENAGDGDTQPTPASGTQSSGGAGGRLTVLGGAVEPWGAKPQETEIWTPDRPLFRGADKIGEIRISRAGAVREIAEDQLQLSMPEIITASGALIDAIDRIGTAKARISVSPVTNIGGISVSWQVVGRVTRGARGVSAEPVVGAQRTLFVGRYGTHLEQEAYLIHPQYQGRGLALESVIRQTSVPGISSIATDAARSDSLHSPSRMDGYWKWPLYGYNAPIRRVIASLEDRGHELPKQFRGAKSLLDIYAMPGGIEMWRDLGGDIRLTWDTSTRSQSRLVLLELQDRVAKKHGSRSIDVKNEEQDQVASDCDNDPDVLEAWEDIIKRGTLPQAEPGRLEELDAAADEAMNRRAKDGGTREVRPH